MCFLTTAGPIYRLKSDPQHVRFCDVSTEFLNRPKNICAVGGPFRSVNLCKICQFCKLNPVLKRELSKDLTEGVFGCDLKCSVYSLEIKFKYDFSDGSAVTIYLCGGSFWICW